MEALAARSIRYDIPFSSEHRTPWPDGTVRWLSARGHFSSDPVDSGSLRLFGVVQDITNRKHIRPDGARIPILMGAAMLTPDPLEWICLILDLSERKQLETQLIRTPSCTWRSATCKP